MPMVSPYNEVIMKICRYVVTKREEEKKFKLLLDNENNIENGRRLINGIIEYQQPKLSMR